MFDSTDQYETGLVLSNKQLKELIQSSKPEKIEDLPIEVFPRYISAEMIAAAPESHKDVLNRIAFDIGIRNVNQRLTLEKKYGDEVASALFYFSDHGDKSEYKSFKRKLKKLIVLYKTWSSSKDQVVWLSILPHIQLLNSDVEGLYSEVKALTNAKSILHDNLVSAELEDKMQFQVEMENLLTHYERCDDLLGKYFHLRLMIIGKDMHGLSLKLKSTSKEAKSIQAQINKHHEELIEMSQSTFLPFLSKRANTDMKAKVTEKINILVEDKNALEVPISETDLIHWLDAVADAAITSSDKSQVKLLLNKIRMLLFHLLQKFCEQQEAAAVDVAQNPFNHSSPENMIKYLIKSEEFILNYFQEKKQDTAAWFGDLAGTKVDMLNDLEKSLFKELKRSKKFLKK